MRFDFKYPSQTEKSPLGIISVQHKAFIQLLTVARLLENLLKNCMRWKNFSASNKTVKMDAKLEHWVKSEKLIVRLVKPGQNWHYLHAFVPISEFWLIYSRGKTTVITQVWQQHSNIHIFSYYSGRQQIFHPYLFYGNSVAQNSVNKFLLCFQFLNST